MDYDSYDTSPYIVGGAEENMDMCMKVFCIILMITILVIIYMAHTPRYVKRRQPQIPVEYNLYG